MRLPPSDDIVKVITHGNLADPAEAGAEGGRGCEDDRDALAKAEGVGAEARQALRQPSHVSSTLIQKLIRLREELQSRTDALDASDADLRSLREDSELLRRSNYELREERARLLEV